MTARLRRKEIKQDEFVATLQRGMDFVGSHRHAIVVIVTGILLMAVVAAGVFAFLHRRTSHAATALAEAMAVYEAADGDASEEGRAEELFQRVSTDFSGTRAAAVARVYLAQMAAERGNLERARVLWEGFLAAQPEHALAAEVRLNLLALDRQQGRDQEMLQQLEDLLASERAVLPEDTVLYELAQTLQRLDRQDDAIAYYQRIVDEFPRSPYRLQAQSELNRLAGDSAPTPLLGS